MLIDWMVPAQHRQAPNGSVPAGAALRIRDVLECIGCGVLLATVVLAVGVSVLASIILADCGTRLWRTAAALCKDKEAVIAFRLHNARGAV